MQYLHTMVRVSDLDASLAFYRDLLGMVEVDRKDVEAGRFTLVFLSASDDVERYKKDGAPSLELTYNWDPEEYGEGRILEVVQRNLAREPQQLLEAVFSDVREFAKGAAQNDDITAMVLRFGSS